jgi:hypothetical protein
MAAATTSTGRGLAVAVLATATILAALTVPAPAGAEIDFDAQCTQRRLRAVAVGATRRLRCVGVAHRFGPSQKLTDCNFRTTVSFRKAWNSIERSGSCAVPLDVRDVESAAFAGFSGVTSAVPNSRDDWCTLGGLSAIRASAARQLSCYANAARRRQGADPQCIADVADTMAATFQRLYARGCTGAGDWDQVNARIAAWNRNAVAAVSTVCGDGIRGLLDECDGADDEACPGQCGQDCLCPQ